MKPGRRGERGVTWRMARAVAPVCACVLSACAYYNGMYNTKRFARSAERSERAGRTSEAADRWRQVVVHADTLLSRHPDSRWADDAELLKGRALVALRAWPSAAQALESAKGRVGTEDQLREAQYWLGIASAGRLDYRTALANFDSALASSRRDHRQAVRLARGRALMAMGRPAEALRDFEAVSGATARFERATAAIALDQPAAAAAHADSAVGARDVTPARWSAFLDTLGRRGGVPLASDIVVRLAESDVLTAAARARLLLDDADRLAAAGRDSLAVVRWEAVTALVREGDEGRLAEVRRLRHGLRQPDAAARVEPTRERLAMLSAAGGESGREAQDVLRILEAAGQAPGDAGADARAFRSAEWLRDSIPSRPLAAEAFAAMAATWPESPWAPKAILAAIAAGHPAADSLRRELELRYGDSPYTLAASGADADPEAYAVVEDSLARMLELRVGAPAAGARAAEIEALEEERLRERRAADVSRGRAPAPAPPPAVRTVPERAPTHPRNPEP